MHHAHKTSRRTLRSPVEGQALPSTLQRDTDSKVKESNQVSERGWLNVTV